MRPLSSATVLPALLLLALAAACGGGGDGAEPSPAATPSPTPAAAASPSPAAQETASPAAGQTATPPGGTPIPTPTPEPREIGMTLEEFRIVPEDISSNTGAVTFRVRNGGIVTHQFLVIRTDLSIAELPRVEGAGVDESKVEVVDRIDAVEPGEEERLVLQLEPAKYAVICNLVVAGNSHYVRGMYNGFTVKTEGGGTTR